MAPDNEQTLLKFNAEGALSNILAAEEHANGGNAIPINSWCIKKHLLLAANHHCAEASQLLEVENPQLAQEFKKMRLSLLSEIDDPSANRLRTLRNEFRRIAGDPSLGCKDALCKLDTLSFSEAKKRLNSLNGNTITIKEFTLPFHADGVKRLGNEVSHKSRVTHTLRDESENTQNIISLNGGNTMADASEVMQIGTGGLLGSAVFFAGDILDQKFGTRVTHNFAEPGQPAQNVESELLLSAPSTYANVVLGLGLVGLGWYGAAKGSGGLKKYAPLLASAGITMAGARIVVDLNKMTGKKKSMVFTKGEGDVALDTPDNGWPESMRRRMAMQKMAYGRQRLSPSPMEVGTSPTLPQGY